MTPSPVPARRRSHLLPALVSAACALTLPLNADDQDIQWLVNYDGKAAPDSKWTVVGTPKSTVTPEGLQLLDEGTEIGNFRTAWKAEPESEIIIEATVKVLSTTGSVKGKPTTSLWPWRDGAPVNILIGDGKHEEGLVLFPHQATSHTDRFIPMDTTNRFHTYRLVIRSTDMQMLVDGEPKVEGQNAFWRAASSTEPFIQFGSSSERATGSAIWQSVKLGVRKMTTAPKVDPIKLTVSEPWLIERQDIRQTRPYMYDMGKGLLLMSAAQGKDFFYEPYGLLKSTDAGKTWTPIPGLDKVDTTPLPCLRRPDGSILAVSRWTRLQPDGSVRGKTVHLNADATSYTMIDNVINLPKQYIDEVPSDHTICERHIWNDADGGVTMVLWTRKAVMQPNGRKSTERWSHLMRSMDEGKTWNYFSTIGPGGEPAVVRLSDTEQMAVIRGDRDACMKQMFSSDAGKTWSKPVALEVGKVLPDLVLMSNGVLACSYGRPASCLMFSLDGGRTWPSHHVLSEKVGFNYTSIREISPGRLLYLHDAPKMSGMYVDVQLAK